MNLKIVIRSETDADVSAISEVTLAAFKTLEISNHTEQFIIAALRAAKALTISLVAEVPPRTTRPAVRTGSSQKSSDKVSSCRRKRGSIVLRAFGRYRLKIGSRWVLDI